MNILARLAKIEEKLNSVDGGKTEFCNCFFDFLLKNLSDSLYPDLSKPVCDICGKPVSKRDTDIEKLIWEVRGRI